ncbi:MAG: class I SAM-dependent methyltransferase [Planctomycetota bacterium]|nr:class I SAM-dependent methyltransferase [Planctomycetota bacterium]
MALVATMALHFAARLKTHAGAVIRIAQSCGETVTGQSMQYDRDYFEGRTSFFYSFGGYRDVDLYFGRLARWFLPHAGAGPLLDFGCAYGYLLARFDDGRPLSGCDVSPWALQQAERRLPHADFRLLDPDCGLPYGDRSFAAVLCTDVLEHIEPERQAEVLGEVARVLAPGGRFCMTTPNRGIMRRCLYSRADRTEGHVGMRHFGDWRRLLAQNGLPVVAAWTYLHGFLPGRFRRLGLPECAIVAQKA